MLKALVHDLQSTESTIVVGAGVSIASCDAAAPASWPSLLRHGIERAQQLGPAAGQTGQKLKVWIDNSNALLAEESFETVGDRIKTQLSAHSVGEYNRWLLDAGRSLSLKSATLLKEIHKLRSVFRSRIITTNYDKTLSAFLGLDPIPWTSPLRVEQALRESTGIVHLHGIYDQPESVILGTSDYTNFLNNAHAQVMLNALRATTTFVYIGFGAGIEDPTFQRLHKWAASVFTDSAYRHYLLVRESDPQQVKANSDARVHAVSYGTTFDDLPKYLASLTGGSDFSPKAEDWTRPRIP